jgi:hypothetical protein
MGYYHNILNLISLVLVLAILFIVLFGCQFKKYRRIEKFTDKKKEFKKESLIEDEEEPEPEPEIKSSKVNDVKKEDGEDSFQNKETLEGFEGQILQGLTSGSITSNDMDKFINAGTFTRENLENIISYVEKFKSQFS